MKRRAAILFLGLALVLAGLAATKRFRRGPASSRPAPVAATPPGVEVVTAADLRAALHAYREHEGAGRRGPAFERFACAMMHRHVAGAKYTEADVLHHLGPPDLCVGSAPNHSTLAYFYDTSGGHESAFMVDLADDGRVRTFGVNERFSASDFSHPAWHPFDEPIHKDE